MVFNSSDITRPVSTNYLLLAFRQLPDQVWHLILAEVPLIVLEMGRWTDTLTENWTENLNFKK